MSEWVKVSERLPTREEKDELGHVWAIAHGSGLKPFIIYADWLTGPTSEGFEIRATHWASKPCQEPPEPPGE